jgi:hypothetical protein
MEEIARPRKVRRRAPEPGKQQATCPPAHERFRREFGRTPAYLLHRTRSTYIGERFYGLVFAIGARVHRLLDRRAWELKSGRAGRDRRLCFWTS